MWWDLLFMWEGDIVGSFNSSHGYMKWAHDILFRVVGMWTSNEVRALISSGVGHI